jgi:hypothetical protein
LTSTMKYSNSFETFDFHPLAWINSVSWTASKHLISSHLWESTEHLSHWKDQQTHTHIMLLNQRTCTSCTTETLSKWHQNQQPV